MHVYRVAYRMFAGAPLDGEGSFLYGGRWSSPGTGVAYTSTSLPLAMLEFLANVDTDDFDRAAPPQLVYVKATVTDSDVIALEEFGAQLPSDWDTVPALAADATIGDAWIASGRSLALTVPSVVLPAATPEHNVLLNPRHPRFGDVTWELGELAYDWRVLAARRGPGGVHPQRR